jgi:hypothetical protein
MGGRVTLENNAIDRATAGGKVATSFIPVLGSAVGELLGQLIPAQRLDRIVDFIRRLDQKVACLEAEVKAQRVRRDVDLIETALLHATRAPSEERRERISCLVAKSLNSAEVDLVAEKQLLDLLSELNDTELLILQSYAVRRGPEAEKFREQHQHVLIVRPAHLGSPSAEVDKETIHRSFRERLIRLELLRPAFQRPQRNQLPEFDEKTGMMKANGHEITWLGRMVLGAAGLTDDLRARRQAEEQLQRHDAPAE